jgi:hypothetical protein
VDGKLDHYEGILPLETVKRNPVEEENMMYKNKSDSILSEAHIGTYQSIVTCVNKCLVSFIEGN